MGDFSREAQGLLPAISAESLGRRVGGSKFLQQNSGLTYYDVALRIGSALNIDPATVILHPMTANTVAAQSSVDDQIGVRDVHETALLFRGVDKGKTNEVCFVPESGNNDSPVLQVEVPRYKIGQLRPNMFDFSMNLRNGYMRAGYENDVFLLTSGDRGDAHVALKQRGPCAYGISTDLAKNSSDTFITGSHRKQQAEDEIYGAFLSNSHMGHLLNMRVRVPAFAYSLSPYTLVDGEGTRLLANLVSAHENDLDMTEKFKQSHSIALDTAVKRFIDVRITDERLLTWRRLWLACIRKLPARESGIDASTEVKNAIESLSSYESPRAYLHNAATYYHVHDLDNMATDSDSDTLTLQYDPNLVQNILQLPRVSRNMRSEGT